MSKKRCQDAVAHVKIGSECHRLRRQIQKYFSKGDKGYKDHETQVDEAKKAYEKCEVYVDVCKQNGFLP